MEDSIRRPTAFRTSSTDTVILKKLQLKNGVEAPDVWGSEKNQPALVSIHLALRDGFGSAASKDALDQNTIHYGQLAKQIQARCNKSAKLPHVFDVIKGEVTSMATRTDGSCKLAHFDVELSLPKASMHGEGVDVVSTFSFDVDGRSTLVKRKFVLRDMKLMVLIGVNDNERTKKQPVVVNLDLTLKGTDEELSDSLNAAAFKVEPELVQIIENTSFETLEALATFTCDKLQTELHAAKLPCSLMKLRLEKPHAVRDAHAPGVEIIRPLSLAEKSSGRSRNAQSSKDAGSNYAQFHIVKPYI